MRSAAQPYRRVTPPLARTDQSVYAMGCCQPLGADSRGSHRRAAETQLQEQLCGGRILVLIVCAFQKEKQHGMTALLNVRR